MANRENPAMKTVKAPTSEAGVPALTMDAGSLELGKGDDPMLPSRDPGDEGVSVAIADFCMHVHA